MTSDPSGWETTRRLPLRTRTMFLTGTRTYMKLPVLPESMMATLGSEGLNCIGRTDGLGGGGGENLLTLSTVGTILFTTYNNLVLLFVNCSIVQSFPPRAFQKTGGRYTYG